MRREATVPDPLRIYDLETGEQVRGVTWFDDETGEHGVALRDEGGKYLFDGVGGLVTETRRGGIVVRSEADPTFELVFPNRPASGTKEPDALR